MSKARRQRQADRRGALSDAYSDRVGTPVLGSASGFGSGAESFFSGRALWITLSLIAVNVVIYAPLRHHDFINYDDPQYVSQNAPVLGGLTWHSVWWAFTTTSFSNWHPLTWISHMLDVQMFGMNPGAHHLVNLALHIANSILLLGVLYRMTGALGRSAFVAGLFAAHPLHVESVAWISERKDVLSTLFWMLTLWAYAWYVRRPRRSRYLLVVALFALGLMAKPMLVTLPFILLLLDFWPLRRVTLAPRPVNDPIRGSRWLSLAKQLSGNVHLVLEKLPLFALSVASSIITFIAQQRGGAIVQLGAFPWKYRAANALVTYFAYIGKMLWPARLAAFYPYGDSLPAWLVAGAALGLIGATIMVVREARPRPYLPVGWLWYLGTLVPVIGLVQVGSQSMADRYTYVPLIGLFIIVAWGVPDLLARWPHRRPVLSAAAVLTILVCAVSARGQVRYWENTNTLWEHALKVTHGNYVAHNNLGVALASQGRVDEAIAQYSEAVRLKPDFAEAYYDLGLGLASQGKVNEAIAQYSEALRLNSNYAEAHNNLGVALAGQGKISDSIAQYSEALRLKPDDAVAHNNLGNLLARQGKVDEAIAQYHEALRLKPDFAQAYYDLGLVLAGQKKVDEAIHEYREALRINPGYQQAREALALEDLISRSATHGSGAP